jgi:epidermal growth factor receptor substrate 15
MYLLPHQLGVLTGEACYAFLLTSKLPQATLGTIWSMVDSANNGYLTKDGWYRACRLIGWAQKGDNVSEEFATKRECR